MYIYIYTYIIYVYIYIYIYIYNVIGAEPDPNTPEGLEYWKSKYGIKERPADRPLKPISSFFSRALEVLY
jgi:hypothetical protein